MANFKATLEKYNALSRPDLLSKARKNAAIALSHLRHLKAGSENELLSAIVAAALGADDTLSDDEIAFMGELFSVSSKEKLKSLTARFESEKMRTATDRMVDSLDTEGKRAICTLCLCILASDKQLAPKENEFLLRLLE